MKKIGIFGGTFDPIHFGHIDLAKQALLECNLDHLIVIPAKIQPFKVGQAVVDAAHRLKMASLAFEDEEKISVSDLEIKMDDISYTIHTLTEIKKQYPNAYIAFIIGTDAFLKVEKWRAASEILTDYSFIVGTRPGYKAEELSACIVKYTEVYNTDIRTIDNRQWSISSTQIKERIRAGKSCKNLIPDAVERYIAVNGLYRELY